MAEVSPSAQAPRRGRYARRAVPRIYLSPPHLTGREAELVAEAIESNWIAPLGPHVDAFERELAAVAGVRARGRALERHRRAPPRASSCSGSAPGDEVACSDLTFAASANAIAYTGATPFFVDCDEATWTMDPELLDRAIAERRAAGARVRAVVAVDLYGQCCDYDADPRGVRAPRRRPRPGRGRVARGDVPRRAGGRAGRARRLLVQRQQDHHDERRRDARLREPRPRRARAQALDAGARAGRPLRAPRGRLQLPDEQPARRARPRAARVAAGARSRRGAGSATATASCSTACPGIDVHAGGGVRRRATPGSRASSSSRTRSAPTARRSGSRSRPRTSRRGRSGSRCTSSRSTRRTSRSAATSRRGSSSAGSACRAGRRSRDDQQDRVVAACSRHGRARCPAEAGHRGSRVSR